MIKIVALFLLLMTFLFAKDMPCYYGGIHFDKNKYLLDQSKILPYSQSTLNDKNSFDLRSSVLEFITIEKEIHTIESDGDYFKHEYYIPILLWGVSLHDMKIMYTTAFIAHQSYVNTSKTDTIQRFDVTNAIVAFLNRIKILKKKHSFFLNPDIEYFDIQDYLAGISIDISLKSKRNIHDLKSFSRLSYFSFLQQLSPYFAIVPENDMLFDLDLFKQGFIRSIRTLMRLEPDVNILFQGLHVKEQVNNKTLIFPKIQHFFPDIKYRFVVEMKSLKSEKLRSKISKEVFMGIRTKLTLYNDENDQFEKENMKILNSLLPIYNESVVGVIKPIDTIVSDIHYFDLILNMSKTQKEYERMHQLMYSKLDWNKDD